MKKLLPAALITVALVAIFIFAACLDSGMFYKAPNTYDNNDTTYTDPSDPTEPTDLTDPSDPTDPTDPSDPSDPTDSIEPSEPTEPTVPDVPDEPDTPDVPDEPDTPDVPDEPDTPDVPDEPDTPDVPDEPDTPDVPDEPDTPDVPEEPDTPDVPDEPDTPDVPDEPEIPAIAGTWKGRVDASQLMAYYVNNSPEFPEYAMLLNNLTFSPNYVDLTVRFLAEGSYSISVDTASIAPFKETLKQDIVTAIQKSFGSLADVIIQGQFGMTVDQFVASELDKIDLSTLPLNSFGTYETKDDRLYLLTYNEDGALIENGAYFTFTLNENTLILTDYSGTENREFFDLGLKNTVFTRQN